MQKTWRGEVCQHLSQFTRIGAALLFGASAALASPLALTTDGVNLGFTLSTFATLNPGSTGCCGGPFGIAMASNGHVIVSDGGTGQRYVFNDVDGQTTGSALSSTPSSSGTVAYATAGGKPYGGQGGQFVAFNDDGTINHVLSGVGVSPYLGMWGNPIDGHIIATSSTGLIDIDPLANSGAGSFRVINFQYADGVSVSPDGSTVYAEIGGQVIGYNIITGLQTYASGYIVGSPDGTGVITSSNSLNGKIVVNDNYGDIYLLDPTTNQSIKIASGGTRGDYVSPDTSNGSLFLAYSDIVARLSCGPNCSIGGPPPPPTGDTPEPATFALLGLPLAAMYLHRRRQSRQ